MVIATGFFDGVHLGHRFVIEALVREARKRGEQSMVVSFWPHPRMVLQKDAASLRLLSSRVEKRRALLELGVDRFEVLDFTREFSHLSTEEYLRDYIVGKFGGTSIVLGYDNRMGFNSGSQEDIRTIAEGLGVDVIVLGRMPGESISSTKIRKCLSCGKVEDAAAMLGTYYGLHGVVVSGHGMGRKLGFPTANMLLYEPLKLIPRTGVYLVGVETIGKRRYGMCNIGYRPTVSERESLTIETNIFDFDEDIYGLDLSLSFIKRIRTEKKFPSMQELSAQLAADKELCLSISADFKEFK